MKIARDLWFGLEFPVFPTFTIGYKKSELLVAILPIYGISIGETLFQIQYGYIF